MDSNILTSINARKTAFTNAYKIEDQNLLNEIDDLFKRINDFGATCNDVMDFETKFATNELNQEYINLFTKIASSCKPIVYESSEVVDDHDEVKEEIISDLKYVADDAVRPVRRKIKGAIYDKVRDIPGVSDVLLAKQYKDLADSVIPKKEEEQDD